MVASCGIVVVGQCISKHISKDLSWEGYHLASHQGFVVRKWRFNTYTHVCGDTHIHTQRNKEIRETLGEERKGGVVR
jgi:hypothetical protein